MPFIRTVSGIRATWSDNSINSEVIEKYAKGFAKYLPHGKIVIGRDGRPSGKIIEEVLCNTLVNSGRDVVLIGLAPTPTVQVMVEHLEAVAGIAITASHNPSDWNGMKFINSDGVFLDAEENRQFWEIVDSNNFDCGNYVGTKYLDESAISTHISRLLAIPFISENIELIKSRKFKVAVDAVNASGSVAVVEMLERLDAEVVPLYCDSTGIFPHEPEPLPKNLTELAKSVKDNDCTLGIAVDPDADRLVLVDEHGNTISEEMTLAIATDITLEQKNSVGNVVVNLSSSLITKSIADKYDCKVLRSAVGEINVVKKMKESGAIIGGEGSGGVILPDCHYGRDSLVGIVLVLMLLAARNTTLSSLLQQYPKYYILKHKQEFDGNFDEFCEEVIKLFPNGEINKEDGIRIDFNNSWIQARKSNTEPIIRIIAESDDEEKANAIMNKAIMLMNKRLLKK